MKSNHRTIVNYRLLSLPLLIAIALGIAACQPIVDPATGEAVSLPAAAQPAAADASDETASADDAQSDAADAAIEDEASADEGVAQASETEQTTVEAEILVEPAIATITTRSLRVREAPDAGSEVVAGAREGESYPVIAISADGAWVQIEIVRSETGVGWVSTSFISMAGDITETTTAPVASPSASAAPPPTFGEVAGPTATVDTRSLIVRALPEEDAEVIAGLNLGDSFNVLGISPDGVWLQLELTEIDEGAGWVQANFVRLAGDLTAIPTIDEIGDEVADLELAEDEAGADDAADSEAGGAVTAAAAAAAALGDTDDEASADEAGVESGVEAVENADEEAAAIAPATGELTASTATVNTRSLFVRELPNSDSDPVAGAREGESYPVIAISADGLWVQIETPRSETGMGWVSAEFVTLD